MSYARPSTPPRLAAALLLCSSLLSIAPRPVAGRAAAEPSAQPEGLHRWGAVTLFHGLPSDQVQAVAQDADGVMWFGTDAGLARYDGRRVQTVTDAGLAGRQVAALGADDAGALWVGTDDGAFVRAPGAQTFEQLAETKGEQVTAVATAGGGRAVLATAGGLLFDCRRKDDGSPDVRQLGARLTKAAGKAQPLELTSLAIAGDAVVVGTRGRGLMTVGEGVEAKEVAGRSRAFFVESLGRGADGALYYGAQTSPGDGGLFRAEDAKLARASKLAGATGTVAALAAEPGGGVYAGTDGRGVFHYRGGQLLEHLTFAETAGGLRSDVVNAVFVDHEGVVWFGTPRGVCRYDPRGVRVEQLSEDAESNFVRSLYRTSRRTLLAGTNRGLFVRDSSDAAGAWRGVPEVQGRTVYALAEDGAGLLLVGTSAGLYVGLQAGGGAGVEFAPEKRAGGPVEGGDKENSDKESKGGGKETDESAAVGDSSEGDAPEPPSKKVAEPALKGSVRAIARFGDAVYLATYGRGLERFEGQGRRALVWPRQGEDERGREVVSLYADAARGRLWVGTANAGVFYFDGRAVRKEPALAALEGATVWGASAADGWLWLATSRGLYAFREGRPLVEVAPGTDARAVVAVASDALNSSDASSAANPSSTSSVVNPSSTSGAEGATRGLPRAWCATAGAGLLRVALDAQFGAVTSRLDTEQGLPTDNAFAVLAPAEGDGAGVEGAALFVGTTRGLARYEPAALAPALRLVRVAASRAYQPEELRGGALRLEYPQNSVALDVAAGASRTFPEQFQYAFVLEDSRGRAIKRKLSHDSQFQADGLPAGSYRVTALAYTLDLVPSRPLVFEFEVARAPFPRTTVALSVLLALALIALAWAYFQHRRIVRNREELREANRQLAGARLQLASEAESERRRIARDLHDQTLADLRRLLLLTDEMQQPGAAPLAKNITGGALQTAALDPAALRAEIEAISQEVRRICEDLSPSVLENVGFAAALEFALASALAQMPAGRRFTYDFACDEDREARLAPAVQMQVYRIVQEAVSNVCRHAEAAHVSLGAHADEAGLFTLTLEDDGRGFDAGNRRALRGRGLAGIRARASLIEAEVEWRRRDGGGTAFVLTKVTDGIRRHTL
ncbi:MAG TPA: two-component regulator propeller domain-containing protein [Pyrinomonadaceae bacterium]|nr:two-component regulator propeller domain-containing protein [Pyrinomonadaceae bacterium]